MSKPDVRKLYGLKDTSNACMQEAEKLRCEVSGSHERLRNLIVQTYELATKFGDDSDAYELLKARPFWGGKPPNDILRGVMRYVFNAPKTAGANYERACCYTKALMSEWLERTPPDKIAAVIDDAGGIEGLYCRGKALQQKGRQIPSVEDDDVSKPSVVARGNHVRDGATEETLLDGKHLDDNVDDDEQTPGKSTDGVGSAFVAPGKRKLVRKEDPKRSSTVLRRAPSKYGRAWCQERLVINTIRQSLLQQILELEANGQEEVLISIVRRPDDGDGFKHYEARRYPV